MGLILNLETSAKNCSVALSVDGQLLTCVEKEEAQFSHAENLSVFIEQILTKSNLTYSDLEAVSISSGPGSYTGLRIGASTAKGLCYALDIPLIALDTLKVMTNWQAQKSNVTAFAPMVDARRMEVFCAVHNAEGIQLKEAGPLILDEHSFLNILNEKQVLFFGSGAKKFSEICQHQNALFELDYAHSASQMCKLSEDAFVKENFADLAYFEPNYLKAFVATVPKAKLNQ